MATHLRTHSMGVCEVNNGIQPKREEMCAAKSSQRA
jgi:hypothetical protein